MLRLFAHANYDFISFRRYAYALTALFILPGLVLLLVRGLNYSIEFTGGTLIQVASKGKVDVGAIRSGLDREGIHGAEIQNFGAPGKNGQIPAPYAVSNSSSRWSVSGQRVSLASPRATTKRTWNVGWAPLTSGAASSSPCPTSRLCGCAPTTPASASSPVPACRGS